ncbi:MAG: FtsX-like permease family protein [Planctomycetes bacterium]|nr:FtsX-like permease family protein [Planctomycetota bacterium]
MSAFTALASLRAVLRHPWQIALSILGIALGVAVVVGIDLAAASSLRGFRMAGEALGGRATHAVRAASGDLPAELFARLERAFPALSMAPVVEFPALIEHGPAADGPRATATVFGIDVFSEGRLRPWLGEAVRAPGSVTRWELVHAPGTGYLSADLARRLGCEAGGTLTLRVEGRRSQVRVLGLIEGGDGDARTALADLLVVDVATAQELSARPERLTRIDLRIEDERDAQAALLAQALPPGVSLETAALRRGGLERLTEAFQLNLRALSMLALLVGVFLVYNTMTFSVVQRRPLIAGLRTLGVTRGEIFRVVAGEALWLGVLGTALGLVLGTQLAGVLLGLVTRTMNDLYFVVTVRELHVDWALLGRGAALGIGATLAGAVAPALEATRERPRLALNASTLESGWRAWLSRLCWLGGLSLALSAALLLVPSRGIVQPFLGLLFLVLGAGLLTPLCASGLARAAAPLLGGTLGMFGRHAARGIHAHLSRTAVAIAALAVAISATIGMGVMISSFRSTFVRWLELAIEADVYCSAPTLVSSHNESTLDPETLDRLRFAPGVEDWTSYRGFETRLVSPGDPPAPIGGQVGGQDAAQVPGSTGETEGAGGAVLTREEQRIHGAAITLNERRRNSFDFLDAEGDEIWPRFETEDALIVSEAFAHHRGVHRDGRIELETDRGPRNFQVLGTFRDFTSDSGVVLLSRGTYERNFDDRGVTSVELFAAPGASVDRLVEELRAVVPADQLVLIRSNRALRESSIAVFDRTFAITGVLRLLATLVAFVGTLSALLSLEMERAREIGVLRAQGVTPAEVRRLVVTETGLVGLIAGLIAIPLGVAIALVLALVINKRSFGWSVDLEFDLGLFLSALGLACTAALLAGLVPAWRMSRTPPALALRGE